MGIIPRMATSWYTIKVQPGQEFSIREELIEAFRAAGIYARIALPTRATGWTWGRPRKDGEVGRTRGARRIKIRPGFLFVDFGGAWNRQADEILYATRGVGCVDSRDDEPKAVPAKVGFALEFQPSMRGVL